MRTFHAEHHQSYGLRVEYLENEKGSVEISFCDVCGKALSTLCEHKKNTWQGEGDNQRLLCDLCGADGT